MITLFAFPAFFGLPTASPHVMKTEIQLKMAGLPYVKDFDGFPAAPKGKLPYIEDEGEIVADSTFVRAHIERKYGIDLDEGLNARQRGEAWATERMLEDHFLWALIYCRWAMDENFAKGPAHFFDSAPEAVRETLRAERRAKVVGNLWAQGMGRHTPDEIADLAGRSLTALSVLLGDRTYMMGERPCGMDATAAAMLAGAATPFFETPVRRRVESFDNLTAYADRMMRRYYPDHPWAGSAEPAAQVA